MYFFSQLIVHHEEKSWQELQTGPWRSIADWPALSATSAGSTFARHCPQWAGPSNLCYRPSEEGGIFSVEIISSQMIPVYVESR